MPFPPAAPVRARPYGHDGRARGELLSGRLRLSVTAKTPILIRGFGTETDPQVPSRPGRDGGREWIVPGSAFHGAIRSLHETVTGSCLRAFDEGFVPSYRQTAQPQDIAALRLAVVSSAAAPGPGGPQPAPMVRLCEPGDPQAHRLDQDVLQQLHASSELRSGDRLRIELGPDGRPRQAWPDSAGDWVVFISDAGTRGSRQRYRAHVRRLTDHTVPVLDDAWQDFLSNVEGADDLRSARLTEIPESQRFTEVTHTYQPVGARALEVVVGMRCLARRTVQVGQPLWVRPSRDGAGVDLVQLSMIWRRRGTDTAGDRVPPGFSACWDPGDLCPSCRMFGSADVRGGTDTDAAAQQRSYRGHVRFGDAVAVEPVRVLPVRLPPMGAPRPGAGQHYLDTAGWAGNVGDPPLREWGSAADRTEPRRLRGRKFYWHTTVSNGLLPQRGQARTQHAENNLVAEAQVFAIGTRLEATVTFTDLDHAQLGSLIIALQPWRAFGKAAALHLGGGRPLGYGSCRIEIDPESSWITTPHDRYTGKNPSRFDETVLTSVVDQFRQAPDMAGARRIWPLLGKALMLDHVAANQVWYPPGAHEVSDPGFKEGFQYWKQSAGTELARDERGARRGYPLQPLPDLAANDQTLDIVTDAVAKPVSSPTSSRPTRRR
ncbi:TIGR03986 family type III CRISPR-associated RAMP protein [Nocardia sp. CA-119907]|uniref:TIGR03986 family type III CRISPR-associated RAMP protein n=1 Tax=Nocardia sp. CA-119907 TaxID=3239973 RepID=UPI003D991BE0